MMDSSSNIDTGALADVRFVLAGTYRPEKLYSMERYGQLVHASLAKAGLNVTSVQPRVVLGNLPLPRKLAGFLDKFLLFPAGLMRQVRQDENAHRTLIHVLDQGNSLYARKLHQNPLVVTCHDLIAASATLQGSSHTSSSTLGRRFHNLNISALQSADAVICVSDKTVKDCSRMFNASSSSPVVNRVYNCLDPSFTEEVEARIGHSTSRPFLLHVGSSAWYKNRTGLLRIYAALLTVIPDPPELHLYGAPLSGHESRLLCELNLSGRVTLHETPSNEEIRSAYHQALALIFPSLEEGFGWPPLEAMACGCPVFASNRQPLTEIGGDAIEYIDPENPREAAAHIASCLQQGQSWRMERATAGRSRAAQFNMERFTSEMLAVYESVMLRHSLD